MMMVLSPILNGHEIARNNLGTITPVPFNQLTGSLQREATMYQGGFPENFIIQNPLSFLVEGVNVIAVQGHNSDPASSDLSLIPMLSIGRLDWIRRFCTGLYSAEGK